MPLISPCFKALSEMLEKQRKNVGFPFLWVELGLLECGKLSCFLRFPCENELTPVKLM